MPLSEIVDIIENIFNVFDDLWKIEEYLYPQERMTHLLDITGNKYTSELIN